MQEGLVISAPLPVEITTADASKEAQQLVEAKKKKANAKKGRKLAKETEREAVKASIAEGAGPSAREQELLAIRNYIKQEHLAVKEVASDGHCLYRSIADQLACRPSSEDQKAFNYIELRKLTATFMREHPEEFSPFLGFEPLDGMYQEYCSTVESVEKAEWGGQLEIKALASCLQRCICIYDGSTVIKMGEEFSGESIKISYHRHYYALGEHYNSLIDDV